MNKKIIAIRSSKEIYVEGNRCFKTFDPSSYSKADLLSEAYNHSLVEACDLPVPKLLEVKLSEEEWSIVTEYVEGETLEQLMKNNPEKEDAYLNFFIDLQRKVQANDCPLLRNHDDKMNMKICDTDLPATLRYYLHNKIDSISHHYTLCHGDFNPSNIVINEKEQKAYVLDWSHATMGNFEADAARSYLLFMIEGKEELANKYLKAFCQKANCKVMSVVQWLPILAASQSVKKKEEEKDVLKHFIYMTDRELEKAYANI